MKGKKGFLTERRLHLALCMLVVAFASAVFAIRYRVAFTLPNFYAEDATVLFRNIYTQNPIQVLTTPFNGYLITGQYFLAYIASGINFMLGGDLRNLPQVVAGVSCVFLGFSASLPFILFRKQLGTILSLLTVLLLSLIPLASYDYSIIGTISNLKFVFLYIAFLLVVYRSINPKLTIQTYILVDVALLVCALTNATVAFLLPLILLPYLHQYLRKKRQGIVFKQPAFLSAVTLVGITILYTAAALARGIPEIPGYLDGPFSKHAILPILDRTTTYALTYPWTATFNNYLVGFGGIATFTLLVMYVKGSANIRDKYVVLAACWAMFLGTVLFIINRPGVGDFYLNYNHKGGPDQFFFAQNMIFIFMLAWLARKYFQNMSKNKIIYVGALTALYLLAAVPFSTSFGDSRIVYQAMGPIDSNLSKACRIYANDKEVIIQIYPTNYWQWKVDRHRACDE